MEDVWRRRVLLVGEELGVCGSVWDVHKCIYVYTSICVCIIGICMECTCI